MTTALARWEYWADGLVHGVALIGALAACAVLLGHVALVGDPALATAVGVYLLGLLAVVTASAVYNLSHETAPKALLRRLDHAAIFLMIAGTYTPFCVVVIGGAWGTGLLVAVWALAGLGALLRLAGRPRRAGVASALYLVVGWLVVVALVPLIERASSAGLVLLFLGGILYSIGVPVHHWPGLRFQRAIWHGFVVAAATCHFFAVLREVAAGSV